MSYYAIYGKGRNPNEALIYAKVNEIGHNTNTSFLKKTNVMYLDYNNVNTLQEKLFTSYLIRNINREKTTSELNSKKDLIHYYGKEKFDAILEVYGNPTNDTTIGFLLSKTKDYNIYKFLY